MLKSLNFQDMRKKAGVAIDNRVRIITAGMGLDELRAVVRGDPPTEKPNPRYRSPHHQLPLSHPTALLRKRQHDPQPYLPAGIFHRLFLFCRAAHGVDPDGLLHPLT